jgi:hypothetical protein
MRATQIIRRGLIAFATVATLSAGVAGVAGAQAVVDGDDAIVWVPIPGYDYGPVYTDGERTAVIGVSSGAGLFPVVVQFLPDFDGAAIINPAGENLIAERQ